MTYIDLINRFWDLDEIWQFSCCETRLYFYLLKTANRLGWEDSWTHSDDKTAANVGVSKNTFKTARNRLFQAGLISFKEGGKGYASKTRYQITYQNLTPNPYPKVEPNPYPKVEPNPYPIYNKTKTKTKTKTNKESTNVDEKVEAIYSIYPTKCVVQTSRSLGKSAKDKEKIKRLLLKMPFEDLKRTIEWYVSDCTSSKTYMKNFSTFLNNLPDVPAKSIPGIKTGVGEWVENGKRFYGSRESPLPVPDGAPPRPDDKCYFDVERGCWSYG